MFRALFFFFFFWTSAKAFTVDEECLNYTIYPVQYDITIMPYIYGGHCFYDCHIVITVIANANINMIEMEAKNMTIKGESIQVMKGNHDIVNKPRPYSYDGHRGKLMIYLSEPLIPYKGNNQQYYLIKMNFMKEVTEDSEGVFLVKYDEDRVTKYMIQTRLSPDKAKYFIPCFDNPRFESAFKFTVYVAPEDRHMQYTNTSIVISEQLKKQLLPDKRFIINYVPSPQVTLSQVTFHQSQFQGIKTSSIYTNDALIVWAPRHKLKNCYYILDLGENILQFFRDYSMLNRSITTGPINIIAIPKDLDGYEVGSWNVLTNNAIRVINEPEFISIQQIERMNFELAQQLSRVWLGNPGEPTRTRWREEWFKEGIATYLAYYYLTQYHHGDGYQSMKFKRPLDYYGLQMKHSAMLVDWQHGAGLRALQDFGNEPAANIFWRWKQLVTMKTASILWMVENWIGSQRFHQALVKYINNKRGLYISLQDFMTNLDHDTVECFHQFFNGSTASKVLNSWFRHSGYPVISVVVLRDRTPNAIQLKQSRFSFTHEHRRESDYLIPISYFVQDMSNCYNCYQPRFTIGRQTYTFSENLNNGWIILNTNASGYYRVNYDKYTWKLIAKTLKDDLFMISELNRAQIVNDVFALYVSGDMSQDLAMRILDFLDQERSLVVWESVASGYEMFKIEDAGCKMTKVIYSEWQRFLRRKIVTIYKILTNNIEQQPQTRLFRSKILELACAVKYQTCLDYVDLLYKQWRARNQRIDPDSRVACYYATYEAQKSTLDGNNFNAYEIEDKNTAIHIVRRENHFIYKIPRGEPRPENYTMTTPDPITVSTEKSALTDAHKGSAESPFVSFYLLSLSVLAMLFS
ncbi:aminopeptidase N-like isoform X2 [Ostrinia furnacalis]|uniref:aminopeptidase N-like isoform X2 n=1 Tax=Ostrinia furnacalis TaxID=93504 RepID=UPI00103A7C2E|nr:aminopeptidase N-like isoform X2 [Ostrinia furnacalis]